MDQFYLKNAALYQKLVQAFDDTKRAPRPSETGGDQATPSTVVSARVRPLLDDDKAAGFPCAVYPRAPQIGEANVVDIHDLYNHPRGRPLLKVW